VRDSDKAARRIREIESAIDGSYRSTRLLQYPDRPLVQWYLLLMHEEQIRVPLIFPRRPPISAPELRGRIEKGKGALQYALRWTDSMRTGEPSALLPPNPIDWDHYGHAYELFDLAQDYFGIIAPFILYSRGLAVGTLIDDFTIRFSRDGREIQFDVLDMIVGELQVPSAPDQDPPGDALLALERVLRTAARDRRHGLTYEAASQHYRPFAEYFAQQLTDGSRLGSNWEIVGISANDLRGVLAALKAVCHVHQRCMFETCRRERIEAAAPASAIIMRLAPDWIALLAEISDVSQDVVARVVDACRYDRTDPKRDISLSPLFPLAPDTLAVCPFLVEMGNLERNFLALVARRHKAEYDRASHAFEGRMLEICEQLARVHGLDFAMRRNVRHGSARTEIDAAFYEAATNTLLLAQLKSVIPASEPGEIIERAQREAEALKQAAVLRGIAFASLKDV